MSNRLIHETSPYLLQHAHNPVDWYPWCPEALDRAKNEDKPILLSIGYSACHWCHVMEHESFENPVIAEVMNENFICIKVDREERPDLDMIYMSAVQAMTGSGGWPMTVFLTPDGEPFYGGTYFPPEDRGGLPSFQRVLTSMATAYVDNRQEVVKSTDRLVKYMSDMSLPQKGASRTNSAVIEDAFDVVTSQFDRKYGGLGMQPKFPQPTIYEFILKYYLRSGNVEALHIVENTLNHMAMGGIYDQIGGGFHRYSTDMYWLVPHFEKMLYDNALLARLYLHAYQVTNSDMYRRVVQGTLDYVIREMSDPMGGFCSSQDADSEGVEGKFFVWRPEEIMAVLGEDDGDLICQYYGITNRGNFDGHSILNTEIEPATFCKKVGLDEEEFIWKVDEIKSKLLEARDERIKPGRDDKVLTSWNGLMIAALAEASVVLDRQDYLESAVKCAKFVLSTLVNESRLMRSYNVGRSKISGYLEDYACLVNGLLVLHEATLQDAWLDEAIKLGNLMVDLFWDETGSVFFDTGYDHENLIIRPRSDQDGAMPSGGAVAVDVLLRLSVISGGKEFGRIASAALGNVTELMSRYPISAGHWLCALDFHMSDVKQIAIIGDDESPETKRLLREVFGSYIPNRVLVGSDGAGDSVSSLTPLLKGRSPIEGKSTAFVCENYVCDLPVNDPEDLARILMPKSKS